jgi:hypothetical protein
MNGSMLCPGISNDADLISVIDWNAVAVLCGADGEDQTPTNCQGRCKTCQASFISITVEVANVTADKHLPNMLNTLETNSYIVIK